MEMTMILAAVQSASANGWGHDGAWGWWGGFALIFWLGLTAFAVYLFTHVRRGHSWTARSARDILAERLARGEIDPDEYEERLSHLS